MPGCGLSFRQFSFGQCLGQITPSTNFLIVRHQPGDWGAVFEQHEGDVLVMGAVDAIGKIAGGIGDTDYRLSHKIRLSDLNPMPTRGHPDWNMSANVRFNISSRLD